MKVTILSLTLAAVAGAGFQNAYAGDREWATAGKVLTGVVAGSLLVRALDPAPPVYRPLVCEAPSTVYVAPQQTTVVYQQPVVQQAVVQTTTTTTMANGQQTTTVVTQPAQTIVQSAPVVYAAPAPVIYAPAPVVYMPPPRPFISVGVWGGPFYGHRPYYHGYRHGRW